MKVFIRFIADRSLLSRAIGWRTEGRPSHVEYVIYENGSWYTFGSRLSGGVRSRSMDYCNPSFEEWYTFDGIEESCRQAFEFWGRKYDWADIIELATGLYPAFYSPQRAICSVLVGYSNRMAWAAGKIEKPLINPNVPTRQMTPQLLYGAVTNQVKIGG